MKLMSLARRVVSDRLVLAAATVGVGAFTVVVGGPSPEDRLRSLEAIEAEADRRCGEEPVCRLAVGVTRAGAHSVHRGPPARPNRDRRTAAALLRCDGSPLCELAVGVTSRFQEPDQLAID